MSTIDRYIQKIVLLSMIVAMILTASVDLVFTMAEEIGDTDETYSSLQALVFVFRTLPTGVYELLPYSALFGALFGLGILASNSMAKGEIEIPNIPQKPVSAGTMAF